MFEYLLLDINDQLTTRDVYFTFWAPFHQKLKTNKIQIWINLKTVILTIFKKSTCPMLLPLEFLFHPASLWSLLGLAWSFHSGTSGSVYPKSPGQAVSLPMGTQRFMSKCKADSFCLYLFLNTLPNISAGVCVQWRDRPYLRGVQQHGTANMCILDHSEGHSALQSDNSNLGNKSGK